MNLCASTALARANGTEPIDPANAPVTVTLVTTPLFHVTANNCVVQPATLTGGKIIHMYKWDAGEALKLIEREKITGISGVPVMSREIIAHPDFDKYDTSRSPLWAAAARNCILTWSGKSTRHSKTAILLPAMA